MAKKRGKGLYRGSKKEQAAVKRSFTERYGKKKGDYVRGAVIGQLYRKSHHGKNWNQKR